MLLETTFEAPDAFDVESKTRGECAGPGENLGPGEKYAHDVVRYEPPPVRALVAEVVREEYGREVVLAGVEEEALEDHTTRSPGPAAEECFRAGLL